MSGSQPVFAGGLAPIGGGGSLEEGGIPSGPAGLRVPPARVTIERAGAAKARVIPNVAGVAHVILSVEDDGTPSLTSYRRVIVRIKKP